MERNAVRQSLSPSKCNLEETESSDESAFPTWANVLFIKKNIYQNIPIDEIKFKKKDKMSFLPKHDKDFKADHSYSGKWYTCGNINNAVRCTNDHDHPYNVEKVRIYYLAGILYI